MSKRILLPAFVLIVATRVAAGRSQAFVTVAQQEVQHSSAVPRSIDVSTDGRFVAFESWARLVPADTNSRRDVYVLDRLTGRVTVESSATGVEGDSSHPRLSGDGRYVVFEVMSAIGDPVVVRRDIVRTDRETGSRVVLTIGVGGTAPDGPSGSPDISDDGRIVTFASTATNLVAGVDANGPGEDVYAIDLTTMRVSRISVDSTGAQPSKGTTVGPAISGDGRLVAFASTAPLDRAAGSTHGIRDVYVRDLVAGTTTRASVPANGGRADGTSFAPEVSGSGRYVAFVSDATNLVSDDRNRVSDVFVRDVQAGSTVLVSRAADGGSANGRSSCPAISADGRFIAFQSEASNLVCRRQCAPPFDDINLLWDVFVFDRDTKTLVRASVDELGAWMEPSYGPALGGNGAVLAFSSRHPTGRLDRTDDFDLFVRTMLPAASATVRRW